MWWSRGVFGVGPGGEGSPSFPAGAGSGLLFVPVAPLMVGFELG